MYFRLAFNFEQNLLKFIQNNVNRPISFILQLREMVSRDVNKGKKRELAENVRQYLCS